MGVRSANFIRSLKSSSRLLFSYLRVNWKLFLIGLSLGLLIIYFLPQFPQFLPKDKNTIGIVGNFTISSLPLEIQREMSTGLTSLTKDQTATTGAAISFSATDSGKIFTFKLDPNLFWQDGTKFDTSQINYSLKGVSVKRKSLSEIEFKFKSSFAPLPAIVSQPLFKNGLVGLGEYKLESLKFNGKFLSEITLQSQKTGEQKIYRFYPSGAETATALKLGSVKKALNLRSPYGLNKDSSFVVNTSTDSGTVAALFFNLDKGRFSDKSVRQALAYALPDSFSEGTLAYSPISEDSWAQSETVKPYEQNLELAKETLGGKGKTPIIITSSQELRPVAEKIATAWTKAGQQTKVQTSELLPPAFDVYLSYMTIPPDPDQYALWHSTQRGNIARYNSPKVDKLLEEGRQTVDPVERKRIYGEFQKALSEDLPAIFLFYPKLYTIERK